MTLFKSSALFMLIGGMFSLSAVQAAENFGRSYQPVAAVNSSQTQIVFYRDADTHAGSAHVYLDGEFQSALLPNGYTVFCVAPGSHSLGAFVQDAPSYAGKQAQSYRGNLEAGRTYFVKMGDENGMPMAVTRADAEVALQSMRQQIHMLSRASAVQACDYVGEAPKQYKEYSLSSDVLFPFGKSARNSITRDGRAAIDTLVAQIRRENTTIRNVQVIGHTDQIGSAQANQRLGQQRAETVRLMMVQAGIPARDITAASAGMDEPVVSECYGSRAEKISCYAPNRRVTIRVDGSAVGE